jgi:hypothetical protein
MADVERKQEEAIISGSARVLVVEGTNEIKNPEVEVLSLMQAREKLLINPTPESMTQFNQAFWTEACRVEGEGRKISVPNLSETVEVGDGVIVPFDPYEIDLVALGKMFPKMRSQVTEEGAVIINDNNNSGYFSVNMTVDIPHLDTTKRDLVKILKSEGKQLMSLKHYIIFGQMVEVLSGYYPDQYQTWSRLGSRDKVSYLGAYFYSDGRLNVDAVPKLNWGDLGGRGEKKVIKAV